MEIDTDSGYARGQTVVRLTNGDGERLELAVEGGAVDVECATSERRRGRGRRWTC